MRPGSAQADPGPWANGSANSAQLATGLLAAVLARVLGIVITVAGKRQRAAAGNRAVHATGISRRTTAEQA
ncbi:hypothetical protein [Streptomyces sp. SID8352]|uniref:hypothetical protein n=1 Tax=Streptomyces sp. SID8352 TaxID=2690338 RepID=UPI00139C91D6|nr:hypothetical protein [Streptomyces sp. SID8352]MYU25228.1 hypothetical protein [Streptomyces sp. SID8352]